MKPRLRNWVAISFDFTLVAFVIISVIMIWTGEDATLLGGGWVFLRYFTTDSNILLGVIALIALPFDFLLARKKEKQGHKWLRILYLVGNTGTAITMLTVLFFLGPTMGYPLMLKGGNLFMHLLTPLVAIVRVFFFEINEVELTWKAAWFGAIPVGVYGIAYMINVVVNDGYGSLDYDWYGFGKAGLGVGIVVYFGMLGAGFGFTLACLLAQRKLNALLAPKEKASE